MSEFSATPLCTSKHGDRSNVPGRPLCIRHGFEPASRGQLMAPGFKPLRPTGVEARAIFVSVWSGWLKPCPDYSAQEFKTLGVAWAV